MKKNTKKTIKKNPPNKKLYLIIGIAAVILCYFIFFSGSSAQNIDLTRLKTKKAAKGDMVYSITATGTIEPLRKYELKSIASGKIISMPVDSGSFVKRGGLVCRIDPTEDQNNYNRAAADIKVALLSLKKARADLKRQQALFKEKFISPSTLEDYKLKLAKAQSEYVKYQVTRDNALKKLRETWVRSPISGTILEKYVDTGQIISSGTSSASGGTKIAVMANLNHVFIKAMVDETDISRVRNNQKAVITVDAYSEKKFKGSVYKIEPIATVEQNVTSFLVTVRINNPKNILKPGMNASVQIETGKIKNVLLIPYSAVKKIGKRNYVFLIRKKKVRARPVKLGKTNFSIIEIKKGVREGSLVVVSGITKKVMAQIMKTRKGRKRRRRGGRSSRRMRRMMRKRR